MLGLQKLAAQPGETVLEIGIGTGHSLLALSQAVGEKGQVCGIDLSPKMLDVTRTRMEKAGLAARVRLACGDGMQLPWASERFDAVFMSFVLELFDTPEIPRVLSECRRVLKPHGRLTVVALSKEGSANSLRDLYEWGHARFPQLLDCRPIFVRQALEAAGFRTYDATRLLLWGLPVEIIVAHQRL